MQWELMMGKKTRDIKPTLPSRPRVDRIQEYIIVVQTDYTKDRRMG